MGFQHVPKPSEVLMRTHLLDEFEEALDWAYAPEEGEDPFADLPGVWLDELEEPHDGDKPVVVLDPRVFYSDSNSVPLLDELLFVHHTTHGWVVPDEIES